MTGPMMLRLNKTVAFAAALAVCWGISGGTAHAQTIEGFAVGGDIRLAAKAHPRPSVAEPLGSDAAFKWDLAAGNAVSVTASPQTGSIMFIEEDWGGNAAAAASAVPGLGVGASTLADIRKKFGSNGFGFKSNAVTLRGEKIVSINCYQFAGKQNVVVALVTVLPISDVVGGMPQTGKGRLQAVILADLGYLQGIWGSDRLFDREYQPVEWK